MGHLDGERRVLPHRRRLPLLWTATWAHLAPATPTAQLLVRATSVRVRCAVLDAAGAPRSRFRRPAVRADMVETGSTAVPGTESREGGIPTVPLQ